MTATTRSFEFTDGELVRLTPGLRQTNDRHSDRFVNSFLRAEALLLS